MVRVTQTYTEWFYGTLSYIMWEVWNRACNWFPYISLEASHRVGWKPASIRNIFKKQHSTLITCCQCINHKEEVILPKTYVRSGGVNGGGDMVQAWITSQVRGVDISGETENFPVGLFSAGANVDVSLTLSELEVYNIFNCAPLLQTWISTNKWRQRGGGEFYMQTICRLPYYHESEKWLALDRISTEDDGG